jgi:hypothetical protein
MCMTPSERFSNNPFPPKKINDPDDVLNQMDNVGRLKGDGRVLSILFHDIASGVFESDGLPGEEAT